MDPDGFDDDLTYKVVVNSLDQYSLWPADRENALGWRDAGKSGTKEECLAYIKQRYEAGSSGPGTPTEGA